MVMIYNKMEKELYNFLEYKQMLNTYYDNSYKCKCGHTVLICKKDVKRLCSWCGRYVFINEKEECKYRIMEMLKNEKM